MHCAWHSCVCAWYACVRACVRVRAWVVAGVFSRASFALDVARSTRHQGRLHTVMPLPSWRLDIRATHHRMKHQLGRFRARPAARPRPAPHLSGARARARVHVHMAHMHAYRC